MSQVVTVANVSVQSTVFVVNNLRMILFRFAKLRGLPPDYLINVDKSLREAMEIWIGEQTLIGVRIEVFRGNSGIERLLLDIEYSAEPEKEVVEPDLDALGQLCNSRPGLPPDAKYRVTMFLKNEHTEIPGWGPTDPIDFDIDLEELLPAWGRDSTRVSGVYQASAEKQKPNE